MNTIHPTREAWLNAAVTQIRPLFTEIERQVPATIRVSTGWSKGAKKASVGWCWKSEVAEDGASNIFISPEMIEPVIILAVLTHELAHAANDCRDGHKGDFRWMHGRLGFMGRTTASIPGLPLTEKLALIADHLGDYPHAKLTPEIQIKTQSTRMIKVHAPTCCGYVLRTSQRWIDEGLPFCPCGTEMEVEVQVA